MYLQNIEDVIGKQYRRGIIEKERKENNEFQ